MIVPVGKLATVIPRSAICGSGARLDAPHDGLTGRVENGFAVRADDLEDQLSMIRARNEPSELARQRDLLLLVVHREGVMSLDRAGEHDGRDDARTPEKRSGRSMQTY